MRSLLVSLVIGLVASTCDPLPVRAAEYFKVEVTRVSKDMYKTREGFIIVTRYCYEYAHSEDAILKWDGPGFAGSELIFTGPGGTKCDVDRVLR